MKQIKLNPTEKIILQLIYTHPESPYISFTYKDFKNKLNLSYPTLHKAIKKLAKENLIIIYTSCITLITANRKNYNDIKAFILVETLWR